jgi:hypothetical protein
MAGEQAPATSVFHQHIGKLKLEIKVCHRRLHHALCDAVGVTLEISVARSRSVWRTAFATSFSCANTSGKLARNVSAKTALI